jgi:hypothetical protein
MNKNKCFDCVNFEGSCVIKEPCRDHKYYQYRKKVIAMKKEHLVDYNGVCAEVKIVCKIFNQNEPIKNIIKWANDIKETINITITLEDSSEVRGE